MTMQIFPNKEEHLDFIRAKPIGQVFHSSPARSKFLLFGNSRIECFKQNNNNFNPVKISQPPRLNVKGNGLPSDKQLVGSAVQAETHSGNGSNYDGYGHGFFKKNLTSAKQTKNGRNSLLPQICNDLKERQKSENISDVCLSSSPTLPAFSSSVIYKKVATSKQLKNIREFQDLCPSRGIMIHTRRYQWPNKKSELLTESTDRNHFSSLRNNLQHKQITIPPIRANTLHVVLGGKKIEMEERFSLMREIQRLKCVVLPDHARHLFHGKGFKLPTTHGSLKPRGVSIPDDDKDMEPVLRHLKCRQSTDFGQKKQFSSLKKSSTFAGRLTAPSSVQLSKQKIVVRRLKTKLNLLSPTPLTSPPPPQTSKRHKAQNAVAALNPTENFQNAEELPDSTNKSRDGETAEAEDVDGLQSQEEVEEGVVEEEEGVSQIPATVKHKEADDADDADAADDAEFVGSDKNQDDYHQSPPTTNNLKPLTATPLETVPSSEQDILTETFNKLDSDKDGHLLYSQLKTLLPEKFSINQEKFIKEVYNITSQSTFFGISEFWGMTQLTKDIESLSGPALEAYEVLNFDTLKDSISEYLTDFQSADPSFKGNLSLDALCVLLSNCTKQNFTTDTASWNKVLSNITLTDTDCIRKTNFLAHIPYFLFLK